MGQRLRAAAAILDPLLVSAGFAPAQYGGSPSEPSGVTYCASFDQFTVRHPGLPQADEAQRGVGACVDLVINVNIDDRVTEVHLEGHDLEETCRLSGHIEDAESAATIIGSDVIDAVDNLEPILQSLFTTPED